MSEQNYIDKAQTKVGSADTILAAAWFQPRGTSGGLAIGSDVGNAAGNLAGGGLAGAAIGAVGAVAGMVEGMHSGGIATDRTDGLVVRHAPFQSMVAVSATRIYGWQLNQRGAHREPTEQLFDYARDDVTINVHSRVGVRVFEVIHPSTSEKWELESPRINGHLGFILAALHPDEPATTD